MPLGFGAISNASFPVFITNMAALNSSELDECQRIDTTQPIDEFVQLLFANTPKITRKAENGDKRRKDGRKEIKAERIK